MVLLGGGPAVCVWVYGARTFPNADADAGEPFGLPGFVLLHYVRSLPHPSGSSADAGGWNFGYGITEAAGGDLY